MEGPHYPIATDPGRLTKLGAWVKVARQAWDSSLTPPAWPTPTGGSTAGGMTASRACTIRRFRPGQARRMVALGVGPNLALATVAVRSIHARCTDQAATSSYRGGVSSAVRSRLRVRARIGLPLGHPASGRLELSNNSDRRTPERLGACHTRATRQGDPRSVTVTQGYSQPRSQDRRFPSSRAVPCHRSSKLVVISKVFASIATPATSSARFPVP